MATIQELKLIQHTQEELLHKLRVCEQMLYSAEIQIAMEKDSNELNRQNFIRIRLSYTKARENLENAILEKIAERLKLNESALKDALQDLEAILKKVNNTVRVLNSISSVTRIVSRIVGIL